MVVGKRVFEVVEMFAVDDPDLHLAGEPNKLAGPGIGNDSDVELRRAARHGAAVL
jgi:hypothetical protein